MSYRHKAWFKFEDNTEPFNLSVVDYRVGQRRIGDGLHRIPTLDYTHLLVLDEITKNANWKNWKFCSRFFRKIITFLKSRTTWKKIDFCLFRIDESSPKWTVMDESVRPEQLKMDGIRDDGPRMTVHFHPWPSTLASNTVHYRPRPFCFGLKDRSV